MAAFAAVVRIDAVVDEIDRLPVAACLTGHTAAVATILLTIPVRLRRFALTVAAFALTWTTVLTAVVTVFAAIPILAISVTARLRLADAAIFRTADTIVAGPRVANAVPAVVANRTGWWSAAGGTSAAGGIVRAVLAEFAMAFARTRHAHLGWHGRIARLAGAAIRRARLAVFGARTLTVATLVAAIASRGRRSVAFRRRTGATIGAIRAVLAEIPAAFAGDWLRTTVGLHGIACGAWPAVEGT